MKLLLNCFAIAALFALSTSAATDPFIGTWTLNVNKSKYPPGTLPRQMVIHMEAAGDGIRYRSETIDAGGRTSTAEYIAGYDGKEAIVTGGVGLLLPVSLKRVDSNTVEASYMRGFQVVATSRRVVSKSGRMMTVTTISKDKDGKSTTNIGIYDRTAAAPTR
jgi:hypothetical protein